IEVIFELLEEKGYVRLVDVSAHLGVAGPTTTAMVKRLAAEELLVYERYRGVTLTARGRELARFARRRHGVLHEFLRLLGEEDGDAHRIVEGIEHHIGAETLDRIEALVASARMQPVWFRRFRRGRTAGE
ncbi:MAG: metal-dependent transcriptional regulator, partial [Methanobacteriota archaeon]